MRRNVAGIVFALLFAVMSIGLNTQFAAASVAPASIGAWTTANPLSVSRTGAAAVLLSDGRILVTGGLDAGGLTLNTTDFVNPDGTVAPGPALSVGRSGHTATLLDSNLVLVTGGSTAAGATNTAEVFDPAANNWTLLTSTLSDARSGHAAFVLPDSTVAIVGGSNGSAAVALVELYDPSSQQFTYLGVLNTPRSNPAIAALSDGRFLVAGGSDASGATLATTEIFAPATGSSTSGPSLTTPRSGASASTLVDGRVAIIGGSYPEGAQNGIAELASVEVIDATLGVSTVAPVTLTTARTGQIAALLPANNAVLIADGTNAGNPITSAELFLPWNNTVIASSPASPHQGGSVAAGSGVLSLAGGSNSAAVEQYGYATLQSDLPGYHPGQLVTLTGSGWQPGESVTLTQVQTPPIDGNLTSQVIADAGGNIVNANYAPSPLDVGTSYTVTAVGSKSQAQIQFTDAGPAIQLVFTNAPRTIGLGGCSSAIIIQSQDSLGTASTVNPAVTVNLSSSSSTGLFYLASGCTGSPVTSATILATKSSVNVYYMDTVVGSPSISSPSNNGGLSNPAPQNVTVNQGVTTTAINSPLTGTATYGSPVTFTVNVAPKSPATVTPTGTVTIQRAGVPYGTINLSAGTGSVTISTLTGVTNGTFTAFYNGDSNYKTSSDTVILTITKATAQTPTVTSSSPENTSTYGANVTFTATALAVGGGVPPSGNVTFKNGASSLGTVTPVNGVASLSITTLTFGSHSITATFAADSNYYAATSSAITQTVSQAVLAVTANNQPMTYGGTVPTLTGAYTVTGFENSDTIALLGTHTPTLSTTATSTSAPGPYTITIANGTLVPLTNYNYNFVNGTLTIAQATPGATLNVSGGAKYLDNLTLSATLAAVDSGAVPTGTVTFTDGTNSWPATIVGGVASTTVTTPSAGSQQIVANYGGDTNYTTAASSPKTITPAQLAPTASWSAASPIDYGTTLSGVLSATATVTNPPGTFSYTANGNPVTAATVLPAGSYSMVATFTTTDPNYTSTATATNSLTVNKIAASVTPNVATKVYGASDPALSGGTLSGFVAADGVTASYSRIAGETVLGGPYTISGALSPTAALVNYNITYNTANFTITQRPASVTPNAASKVYGASDPSLSGTPSGFLPADNVIASYSRVAGESVASSPYTISATLNPSGVLPNYNIAYNTAPFTIQQTSLTVTPNSYTRAVGAANPTFTGTVTGVMNNDVNAGNLVITYSTSATTGSPIGSYPITATLSGTAAASYALTVNSGTLSVWAQGVDLIESAVVAPVSSAAGSAIQVTETATNQGIQGAGATGTYFYLATSQTAQTGTYLGSRVVYSLGSNLSSTATTQLALPTGIYGTYYIVACANVTRTVTESNTVNNCSGSAVLTVASADLAESAVGVTGNFVSGGSIQVTDTATNVAGVSPAAGTAFYLATSQTATTGTYLGSRTVPSLIQAATSTATTPFTLPTNIGGTYYIVACANANFGGTPFAESNKANNCSGSTAITVATPDLAESAVSVTGSLVSGGAIQVTDTATNLAAGSPVSGSAFYLTTSQTATTGTYLGSRTVPSLTQGSVSTTTTSWTLPTGIMGTYYIVVCANANVGGTPFAESNKANNCSGSAAITVASADLGESAVSVTGSFVSGGSIQVSETATNLVGLSPAAGTAFYLATSSTATTGTYLGSRTVPSLSQGATSTAANSWTLPSKLSGTYYIVACANANVGGTPFAESNKANNCSGSTGIAITH